MIVEGIVTTLGPSDELNVAPMGPIVDESMAQLVLRPFQTSSTYRNLKARPYGVFHIVDDVLLIAQTALHQMETVPATLPAEKIAGRVLTDSCRWYEFEVIQFDDTNERTTLVAKVVHVGRLRDLFGFNRAKHAVLEATILATRVQLIPEQEMRRQLDALAIPVQKTSGPREEAAFALVRSYVDDWYENDRQIPQ